MAQSSAWRGREVDVTGYYNIGLRPYDPVSGRWLTYDSVWNSRDPNYYSFAGGEPIMSFDADGRIANNFYQSGSSTIQNVRLAGSLFTSYANSSDSYVLGTTAAFIGQALDDIAGRNTPANYVNQAASDYSAQPYFVILQRVFGH
jgi:RHS repeat-associated protein